MATATAQSGERDRGAKMTIRVHAVSRVGQITEDRGALSVTADQEPMPYDLFRSCNSGPTSDAYARCLPPLPG